MKVDSFTNQVRQAWQESRVLDSLLELVGADSPKSTDDAPAFGFGSQLVPKDLFSLGSEVHGGGNIADSYGSRVAHGEVAAIAQSAFARGRGHGCVPVDTLSRTVAEAIDDLTGNGFSPSVIFMSRARDVRRALDLPAWREPDDDGEGLITSNLAGKFHGMWVVEWWDLPKDRIVVIDLKRFCDLAEGKDPDGAPAHPNDEIPTIDDQRAEEIVAEWQPEETEEAEAERLRRLLTQVELSALRSYLVEVRDPGAVRVVMLAADKSDRVASIEGQPG